MGHDKEDGGGQEEHVIVVQVDGTAVESPGAGQVEKEPADQRADGGAECYDEVYDVDLVLLSLGNGVQDVASQCDAVAAVEDAFGEKQDKDENGREGAFLNENPEHDDDYHADV